MICLRGLERQREGSTQGITKLPVRLSARGKTQLWFENGIEQILMKCPKSKQKKVRKY